MKLKTYLVGVLLLLSNCVSTGRDFPINKQIQIGLSDEAFIRSAYGEPFRKVEVTREGVDAVHYNYYHFTRVSDTYRSLMVEFINGKVNGYFFSSDDSDDSTKFDFSKKKAIVAGKTKSAEVRVVLGEPSGHVKLPTALFSAEIFNYPKSQGAVAFLHYGYMNLWPANQTVRNTRFLLVFLDKTDTVVDIYALNTFP